MTLYADARDQPQLKLVAHLADVLKGFMGLQVVQLQWNAQLPWTLKSREPE